MAASLLRTMYYTTVNIRYEFTKWDHRSCTKWHDCSPFFYLIYIYIYISFIYATYFGILLTTVTSTKLCKCRGIKHASEVLPVDNVKNQKHIINPKQYIWLK